jgi:hypothetical protein
MTTDLRQTLGWRLTAHARSAARSRGFTIPEVLLTAVDPEVVYTAYDYGPDREVRQRGDVAVAVVWSSKIILTVLWRHGEEWTDSQVLNARSSSRSTHPLRPSAPTGPRWGEPPDRGLAEGLARRDAATQSSVPSHRSTRGGAAGGAAPGTAPAPPHSRRTRSLPGWGRRFGPVAERTFDGHHDGVTAMMVTSG